MKHVTLMLAMAFAALPAAAGEAPFRDADAEWGLDFRHGPGRATHGMSGGAAWFDMDGDGDDDLFLVSGDGAHRLYRNDGDRLVDVTAGSGLVDGVLGEAMGVIAADYDQDGRTDLYVTHNGPNRLFRNLGGGAFRDVAPELGVAGGAWSTSAAFADFDRDGDLDLYVGNYVRDIDFPYHVGYPNELYVNVGRPGVPAFVELAAALGVDDRGVFGPTRPGAPVPPSPEGRPTAGCALSVATADVDGDGDADLLVGNDFGEWVLPNRFYRNDSPPGGPLVFTDVSAASGFDRFPHYNMGISGSDYDDDGDFDFYLTNLGPNYLLRNDGARFTDVTAEAGPLEGRGDHGGLLTSWGIVWGDVNLNGREDLIVVNGYISAAPFIRNDELAPDHLWLNRGDGTFERVDPGNSGMNDPAPGRGVAATDADGDGNLDFVVVNNGVPVGAGGAAPSRLYLGTGSLAAPGSGWAQLRLRGRRSNLEGIGAFVEAEAGGRVQRRQVLADPVYLSSGSRVVHFGLGGAAGIDSLHVRWPSGTRQRIPRLPGGRRWELREPAVLARSVETRRGPGGRTLLRGTIENADGEPHRYLALLCADEGEPAGSGAFATLADRILPDWLRDARAACPAPLRAFAGVVGPGETATLEAELRERPRRREGAATAIELLVAADGALDSYVLPAAP